MARKHKKSTSSTATGSEWQENLETPKEIDESFKAPAEPTEEELNRTNHGAVLTGGIDSTVMLYQLNETLPKDAKIFPIVLGEKNGNILSALDNLKIKNDIETFDIDDSDADESKMIPLLEWAEKNRVNVIHFAANHDEQEESIPNKMYPYFARLNDLSYINISTPLITVTKKEIIEDAVDKYEIDLSQTAEPAKTKEDDLISEKYQRIREKGFSNAFSRKYQKFIPDPFAVEGKEEEKEEITSEQEQE